ncbi:MAG: hypothetical protein R2707_06420 [Acidimicrobiales bacterium]
MRRPWIVPALIALALVGAVLIWTADEADVVALEEITTAEGLATRIPEGWVVSEQFPFDFVPGTDGQAFDQWTVARACPPDGCGERSLDEWMALAPDLPTFTGIAATEGEDTFNVEVESRSDARIMRAQTEAAARLVFVAAFTDGAEDYVACSVRLGLDADQRLADAIIEVCESTVVVG